MRDKTTNNNFSNFNSTYGDKDILQLKSQNVYFQIQKKCNEFPGMLQEIISAYNVMIKEKDERHNKHKLYDATITLYNLSFQIYLWLNNSALENIITNKSNLLNLRNEFNKIVVVNNQTHTFQINGELLKLRCDIITELFMKLKQDCIDEE